MVSHDEAWRRVRAASVPIAQDQAWERMQREREAERKALAAVQGITLPAMPPRAPGETDREYGVRLAEIAKSHCGPPPRPKLPPKRLPKASQTAPITKPDELDTERLAGMTADFTTGEDP